MRNMQRHSLPSWVNSRLKCQKLFRERLGLPIKHGSTLEWTFNQFQNVNLLRFHALICQSYWRPMTTYAICGSSWWSSSMFSYRFSAHHDMRVPALRPFPRGTCSWFRKLWLLPLPIVVEGVLLKTSGTEKRNLQAAIASWECWMELTKMD